MSDVSEEGEALLRGVLTLRFVSHAQSARHWKAVLLQINLSCFGNPPHKWFLGARFLGAPPLFLKVFEFIALDADAAQHRDDGLQVRSPTPSPRSRALPQGSFSPKSSATFSPKGSRAVCVDWPSTLGNFNALDDFVRQFSEAWGIFFFVAEFFLILGRLPPFLPSLSFLIYSSPDSKRSSRARGPGVPDSGV